MIEFDNFNWLTALEAAIDLGDRVSDSQHAELSEMANNWPTCACGELCKSLPRHEGSDGPKDLLLYALGRGFADEVGHRQWLEALKTFHAIEARTAELLAKGGK